MEDNQDLTPLESPSFDYNKLEEIKDYQENTNNLLNEIIKNQIILIDYFVPTEEELKEQKSQEQKAQKEQEEQEKIQQEQLHEEQEKLQQEKETQLEYNQEVLYELKTLNENISKVEFVNQNTNAYLYILCFGLLVTFVIFFIYKLIRKFF